MEPGKRAKVQGPRAPASANSRFPLILPGRSTNSQRFPVLNFRFYLTLSSKCFSSFLHSTGLLSVFWQYLALPEVYPAIYAGIPTNATRKTGHSRPHQAGAIRGCNPLWRSIPRNLDTARHVQSPSRKLQFNTRGRMQISNLGFPRFTRRY